MENENTTPTAAPVAPQEKVPGASQALIFGIVGIVLCWFWVPTYFIGVLLTLAALVISVMAMMKGGKAKKVFLESPDKYAKASLVLANIGRILGIVGLILSIIGLIMSIIASIAWMAYM